MDDVKKLVEGNSLVRNFEGPLKDTVLVPGRGFIVIRFVADNPGTIKKITLQIFLRLLLILRLLVVPLPYF
jgi:Multicopper oxidase